MEEWDIDHCNDIIHKNHMDGYVYTLVCIVFDPYWNHYPHNNGYISPFPLVPNHSIFLLLIIIYVLITCLGLLDQNPNQDG